MGIDLCFVYEADDITRFEAPPVACRGLDFLFEYPSQVEELKNSVLDPPFVQHLLNSRFEESPNSDFANMTAEEWDPDAEEWDDELEPYIGPTFEPDELVAWARMWIKVIGDLSEEERHMLVPLTAAGFDWMPALLNDLHEIAAQGNCAKKHGIKLHIELV